MAEPKKVVIQRIGFGQTHSIFEIESPYAPQPDDTSTPGVETPPLPRGSRFSKFSSSSGGITTTTGGLSGLSKSFKVHHVIVQKLMLALVVVCWKQAHG